MIVVYFDPKKPCLVAKVSFPGILIMACCSETTHDPWFGCNMFPLCASGRGKAHTVLFTLNSGLRCHVNWTSDDYRYEYTFTLVKEVCIVLSERLLRI